MTRGRTLTALLTGAALALAVLAPCLCLRAAAAKPPSCHEGMARGEGTGRAAAPGETGANVRGCCCAQSPAPPAVAPAAPSIPADPERSLLLAAAEPAQALLARSVSDGAASIFEPPRVHHPPPAPLLPLRI